MENTCYFSDTYSRSKIVDAGAATNVAGNYNQRRHYVQCENKRKGNNLI